MRLLMGGRHSSLSHGARCMLMGRRDQQLSRSSARPAAPAPVMEWVGKVANASGGEVYLGYPGFVAANGTLSSMVWGFPLVLMGKTDRPLKPKPVNNARSDKFSGLTPAFGWKAATSRGSSSSCENTIPLVPVRGYITDLQEMGHAPYACGNDSRVRAGG